MTEPLGLDPRGPRFSAWITSALLLLGVVLSLVGTSTARASSTFGWFAYQPLSGQRTVTGADGYALASEVGPPWALPLLPVLARVLDPGFLVLLVVAVLFLWGVLSPQTQPWSVLFRRLVLPRLSPTLDREDPRPPRFAQGVGLVVLSAGLALHLAGVPLALPIAGAAAFIAAFLNAAFGFCLGCQMYLILQRTGAVGRPTPL